jgi:hypothetical protein
VFVEVAVPVPVPVADARDRLLNLLRGGAGLQDSASAGFREGQAVLLRAGLAGVIEEVVVRSVPAYWRGTTTVVMVRWEATGPMAGLVPPLDANLELDTDEGGNCTLTLRGSYRAPLGAAGAVLDRLILQRCAYAAVQGFLTRLARMILEPFGRDLRQPEPGATGIRLGE